MHIVETLGRLYRHSGQKRHYVFQVALVILLGALNAIGSLAIGRITQNIVEVTYGSLLVSFCFFLAATLAIAGVEWIKNTHLIGMLERIKSAYRGQTTRAILRADYAALTGRNVGDLIGRINTDIEFAGRAGELMITAIRNLVISLMLIIVMLMIDLRFALGFAVPLIAVFLYPNILPGTNALVQGWRDAYGAANNQALDLIAHRTTLKAYRLENKADEWAAEKVEAYRAAANHAIGRVYIKGGLNFFVNCLPLLGCALVGVILVESGALSIQGFISALLLAQIATGELLQLTNVAVNMPSSLACAERLFDIWDIPEEHSGRGKASDDHTVIEFSRVKFCYSRDSGAPDVLDDLSFTVRAGEKVALVGPSGCGKSTVLKLIAGLYLPREGQVGVWGTDIADWDRAALRAEIGFMQQDTHILDDTMRENIVYAKPGATQGRLDAVARQAGLLTWIKEQPAGWDAQVGEKGGMLSGGLRQRVGLARLFIQDAPLLLLDEATSALDAANERLILDALSRWGQGKTQLIIAHRLSAIMEADRILVMDAGRIVEEGTHAQLLRANGIYARLYREQEMEG